MTTMTYQITSLTVVYSIVYSGADQRKHQSSASLAFVRGSHRTGEFPAQKASNAEMFLFDDVIMCRMHLTYYTCVNTNSIRLNVDALRVIMYLMIWIAKESALLYTELREIGDIIVSIYL